MRTLVVNTPHGTVHFAYRGWCDKPVAVFLPGYLRRAETHFGWAEALPDYNLVFARIPDGDGPFLPGGLAEWTAAFAAAIKAFPRPPDLAIGESVGAVIALGLPVARIVAVEPFLETRKLWPVHLNIRESRARGGHVGASYDAIFVDRDYGHVLDAVRSQTLVVGGGEPLQPPRSFESAPSLLDDADFARFAAHPLVEARRLPGGHVLMDQNPAGVLALVNDFLARQKPPCPTTR